MLLKFTDTQKIDYGGKTWVLPAVLQFGLRHTERYTWKFVDFRCPKAGEWFVSGAIPMAYRAGFDMSTSPYLIVEKVHFVKKISAWETQDTPDPKRVWHIPNVAGGTA